jgi:catechol 2,3-dioxygenase-like lactoylglutathione lyase family enzyme
MVRFDHALIFVTDLPAAARDYTRLGFRVVSGGAHEGDPTENALIPLADGSYLELIAFRRRSTLVLLKVLARLGVLARVTRGPLARRFAVRAAQGTGLTDIVLGVDTLAPVLDAARRAGRVIHGPVPGRRTTAAGERSAWELAVPADDELPLVIADVTARALRAAPAGSRHANGATGVAEAVIPVPDAAVAGACFRDILGLSAREDGPRSLVDIGTTRLVLEPMSRPSPGRPVRLRLRADHRETLDIRATHGAVIELG